MRLIDVDALIANHFADEHKIAMSYADKCWMRRIISGDPTINAEPVVRGHWLTWEEQFPGRKVPKQSGLGVFCSACHNHADNMTDFCPNCGADMRKEKP